MNDEGVVIGVKADFIQAALLAVRMALENEKYHEHYIVIYDPDLPPGHLRIVLAHGQDGLPMDHQKDAVEGRPERSPSAARALVRRVRARPRRTRPSAARASVRTRDAFPYLNPKILTP